MLPPIATTVNRCLLFIIHGYVAVKNNVTTFCIN